MAEKTTITNEIYSTLSKLREKYTDSDDIERIDADSKRIGELLKAKGLAENEAIKELIASCRKDVVYSKMKLATDKSLLGNEGAQRELWYLIESREWFLKLLVRDFDGELETIHNELEAELER